MRPGASRARAGDRDARPSPVARFSLLSRRMETHTKPMGPLPGTPGDVWKSPWFWRILILALLVVSGGVFLLGSRPQEGGVLMTVGFCGVALAAAIGAMASLRSRRRSDERLREAP